MKKKMELFGMLCGCVLLGFCLGNYISGLMCETLGIVTSFRIMCLIFGTYLSFSFIHLLMVCKK